MFIVEILIYVFFAWFMSRIASEAEERKIREEPYSKYIWIYILFFTFITAVRWRVGLDSPAYLRAFYRGIIVEDSPEYLWNWLVMTIYNNRIHFTVGLGIAGFLQIWSLVKGCRNYTPVLIWLPIVLFGSRYFSDMMNAVRQMIAACGFFYLLLYLNDRRPIYYLGGVLVLSLIHHSAIILLPIYFITYIPFDKIRLCDHRYICLAIFVICFIIGQSPIFTGLVNYVQPFTDILGYDDYSSRYVDVFEGNLSERLSFGPMMLSQFLCSILVIWYSPQLHSTYCEKTPMFHIWYFLSFCFSCLYWLVYNMGHIVIRPIQYLEFSLAVMLSLLLNMLFESDNKSFRSAFYFTLIAIWLYISTDIYKATGEPIEFSTYKMFFGRM